MALKKVSWTDAGLNALEFFSKQMPLLAAGDRSSCNAMTISWGSLGTLWNRPVCTVYVRPQRYTFNLLEKQEGFAVCIMGEEYHEQLQYCGSKSGRDTAGTDWVVGDACPARIPHGENREIPLPNRRNN